MINPNLAIQANVIADKMYSSKHTKENDLRALMEAIDLFNTEDLTETTEAFSDCQGLLREFACLLTNPEISSKLNEVYFKENAGRLLITMLNFFRQLEDHPGIRNYIIYNRLKTRRMTLSEINFFGDRLPLKN